MLTKIYTEGESIILNLQYNYCWFCERLQTAILGGKLRKYKQNVQTVLYVCLVG